MPRFEYLTSPEKSGKAGKKARKAQKKARKKARRAVDAAGDDALTAVPLRRSTVQAVSRELRQSGAEDLGELVETLLLGWLRDRAR